MFCTKWMQNFCVSICHCTIIISKNNQWCMLINHFEKFSKYPYKILFSFIDHQCISETYTVPIVINSRENAKWHLKTISFIGIIIYHYVVKSAIINTLLRKHLYNTL